MNRIRKNATKKIREILENNEWEFFSHENNYNGGTYGKIEFISHTVEDIQLGHASIYQLSNGKYMVKYATPCKWVSL